jgi:hypothetical protein
MFEAIRDGRGQPRVKCSCISCDRTEVVGAVHGKRGRDGRGQAVQKIQKLGWSYIGGRLRSPLCESRRKVSDMAQKLEKKKVATGASEDLRQPTRAQKREIVDMLEEVYNVEAECYNRGDTDDTVAEVLGVMPGWVAELREEFFGAAGGIQDLADLITDVKAFLASSQDTLKRIEAARDVARGAVEEAQGHLDRLTKIEKAVGPRVMARVK